MRPSLVLCAALACAGTRAVAVESCELNGGQLNPSNGNTTAGKSGLMRCRDGEGGRVTCERELDAGGSVARDDEVFEDGSRKAFGR